MEYLIIGAGPAGLQLCAPALRRIAFVAWKALIGRWSCGEVPHESQFSSRSSSCQASNAPSSEKNDDSKSKDPWTWTHRPRCKQVDEQQPHTDELSEAATVVQGFHIVTNVLHASSYPFKVLLDLAARQTKHHRPAVRTDRRVRGGAKLVENVRHLFVRQRVIGLHRRVARRRRRQPL